MNTTIPVLLTSSVIAHDTGVALKDTNERTRLALESIGEWLKIDPRLPIVLCDGSSFDFSDLVAERFPGAHIECLHFENDQERVKEQGRGYGEGEIVRYALRHSKTIATAGCFAKCTSKLWVANYANCVQKWNGQLLCKGVFLDVFSPFKKTRLAYIDTRFYIASLSFYETYLANAHLQIRIALQQGLEECFLEVLRKNNLRHFLFSIHPVILGVGGGIGTYYKDSLKRRLKEAVRIRLARRHSAYCDLFSE